MAIEQIKYIWGSSTSNILTEMDTNTIENGILRYSGVVSNSLNYIFNQNDTAIQYIQSNAITPYNPDIIYKGWSECYIMTGNSGIPGMRLYTYLNNNLASTYSPIKGGDYTELGDYKIYTDSTILNNGQTQQQDIDRAVFSSWSTSKKDVSLSFLTSANEPVEGVLKIKVYNNSTSLLICAFELHFYGTLDSYKIKNVYYDVSIQTGNYLGASDYVITGMIDFPSFYLSHSIDDSDNITGLFFSISNNTFNKKIEFYFEDLNQGITISSQNTSESNYNYPVAIIENGGIYTEGIGNIVKSLTSDTGFQSFQYWCFSQGLIPYTRAFKNINYWQLKKVAFDTNQDITDCVLANIGGIYGETAGVIIEAGAPNITGGYASSILNETMEGGRIPWGCFKIDTDLISYWTGHWSNNAGIVTYNDVRFDASAYNSKYVDKAPVAIPVLTTIFLIKAF